MYMIYAKTFLGLNLAEQQARLCFKNINKQISNRLNVPGSRQ